MKGIDVSGYNAVQDYGRVAAAGVGFAILKVIRKDLSPDKLFEAHWAGFEMAGVPIQGVYNYSYATTTEKARTDAARVLQVLGDRKPMVWLDVEDATLRGLGKGLISVIQSYAEVIQGAGLQFGVYTYLDFYNTQMRAYANQLPYVFWIARYPSSKQMQFADDPNSSKCPDIEKKLYGWQYSSAGAVDGIVGNVDLDEWYVELEAEDLQQDNTSDYEQNGFREELAVSLGLPRTASPEEVLNQTVTINTKKNRYHASVTPLERLLTELGYYSGEIEADLGKRPSFGPGMMRATALYQSQKVGHKWPDSEWTAGNKSYKTALMI